ncbi:MAG: hypothetical protein M9951_17245 [Burkholderiaceae bacterium]|nr:hypothetical protein [Burkholderiaceae bacterium]
MVTVRLPGVVQRPQQRIHLHADGSAQRLEARRCLLGLGFGRGQHSLCLLQ